jgi:hypothetical protein
LKTNLVGDWPDEMVHELLLSRNEAFYAFEYEDYYAFSPIVLEKAEVVFR